MVISCCALEAHTQLQSLHHSNSLSLSLSHTHTHAHTHKEFVFIVLLFTISILVFNKESSKIPVSNHRFYLFTNHKIPIFNCQLYALQLQDSHIEPLHIQLHVSQISNSHFQPMHIQLHASQTPDSHNFQTLNIQLNCFTTTKCPLPTPAHSTSHDYYA